MGQAVLASIGILVVTLGLDIRRGMWDAWRASLTDTLRPASAAALAILIAQLALLVFVTAWFQLENPAFAKQIIPLTAYGFVLHHVMPANRRLAYFGALSIIGFVTVLGWVNAAWLIFLTLAFAALCHLPVRWAARVAILLVAGTVLGFLRVNADAMPFSSGIWPVLGSILMFRLIVYAYDVRNAKEPVPPTWSVAYFLMLPNVVFPLFPVVDFATMRRTYYDREPFAIYQRGLEWMLRGVVHLLLYRAVYQNWTLAPAEVTTGSQLVQYMVSTFLLYLRVSGTFHFIIGMLHLFGFRLPETHRFFYLASSFTDFWRRINIYWKDFMMKLVFYPAYFPLRKRGETTALVVGTLAVFAITWLTHSYQWFWILGKWLVSWTDGLFWLILGVLLIANSLWEAKHGRKRMLPGQARRRWREALGVAVRATLVFTTICTLWSFWGSPTLGDWFDLMSVERFGARDWLAVFTVLAIVFTASFLGELTGRSLGDADRAASADKKTFWPTALATSAALVVIALATSPIVLNRLGQATQEFARDMRVPELNKRDAAVLQRGYYENLQGVSLQNSQLWELYAQRPTEGQDIWRSGVLNERDDFLAREMKPLFAVFERGRTFRTNRWGMRDRDYEQVKPANTYRVALLGQSYVAGDGVNDGETFDETVEDRWNREHTGGKKLEVLNFAVGSYSLFQHLLLLDDRVWKFGPDAVMIVGHPADGERLGLHISQQLRRGVMPPFPFVQELLTRAQVTPALRETEMLSRLAPYQQELTDWTLRELARTIRARGAVPIWVYLSTPERGPAPNVITGLVDQARKAGFHALDWSDVYYGHDPATLQASPWDFHPNAVGHGLIAERFYRVLTSDTTVGVVRSTR